MPQPPSILRIINSVQSKKCCHCLTWKPTTLFHKKKRSKTGFYSRCKKCQLLLDKLYRANNTESVRLSMQKYRSKNLIHILNRNKNTIRKCKTDFFNAYGNACFCCGETTREFLTMDHIMGGGTNHRALVGSHGVFVDAKKEGYPKDKYRILCMNCNFATRYGKPCPHQIKN